MLKKPVIIMLALLYFLTATGFSLNVHYCFNRVQSVKIDAPANNPCKTKSKAAKMNCCKDKQIKVKVKDTHEGQATSFLSKIFSFHLPKLPFEDFLFSVQRGITERFFDRGPPAAINNGISLLKKICVFRI